MSPTRRAVVNAIIKSKVFGHIMYDDHRIDVAGVIETKAFKRPEVMAEKAANAVIASFDEQKCQSISQDAKKIVVRENEHQKDDKTPMHITAVCYRKVNPDGAPVTIHLPPASSDKNKGK